MCNQCGQKVKDIREIQLGDTIRYFDGKESLVIAVFDDGGMYVFFAECDLGWVVTEETIQIWDNSSKYKRVSNAKDMCGKRGAWYYPHHKYRFDCIVKRANCASDACAPVQENVRNEHPCPQCGRKNDIGVSECWHCLRPNP